MTTTTIRILLGLALAITACGETSEDAPTDISTTGDDTSGGTPSPTVTSLDTTVDDTTTAEESTGTTEGPDDTGTSGGPECIGPDECWQCEPTNSSQLLNRCTDAECTPFDNVARLPLLERDGSLPPLP